MVWGLVFIAFLDFLGLVTVSIVVYLTRSTLEETQKVRREGEAAAERAARLHAYLFRKLGPLDITD